MSQDISESEFKAFIDGDEKVLDMIVVGESNKLLGGILRMVKARLDAEEILQDIFMETWNRRVEFATTKDMYRFMYSRARYKSFDFLKKIVPEKPESPEFISKFDNDLMPDVESLYQAKETALKLRLAVDKLPDQCRKVFIMSRYNGLKRSEIAQKLEINPNTVTQHLIKAVDELKKILVFVILAIQALK